MLHGNQLAVGLGMAFCFNTKDILLPRILLVFCCVFLVVCQSLRFLALARSCRRARLHGVAAAVRGLKIC